MSLFPTDDKQRKALPVFAMIAGYFPKALREVTRVCVANNVRYNPDRKPTDINWARDKSTDQLGALFRHMLEYKVDGAIFEELPPEVQAALPEGWSHVYVLAEAAWRALAALELCIEEQEAKVPFKPLTVDLPREKGVSSDSLKGTRQCPSCGRGAWDGYAIQHEPGCTGVGI